MLTLYHWNLARYHDNVVAWGLVMDHPKLRCDHSIHTSAVLEAAVVDGTLLLRTFSDHLYTLQPEWIDPDYREETAKSLIRFSIGPEFVEHCVQAREEADARRRTEAERILEPGELLLELVGITTLQAIFRPEAGPAIPLTPTVHSGMFQDSILITDWESRTVDFRYFPRHGRLEPYHISEGLRTIKVWNLGSAPALFGDDGKEVVCRAGEVTAIPAAEHDREGLFSPDAVNGKGLYQTLFGGGEENQHGKEE